MTTVLLVDDEVDYLAATASILRRQDYDVATAKTAAGALELLRSREFDVVVTDMAMPGLDGLQLLEQMRERGDATPVILVSGAGSIDTAIRAVKLGAVDFLEKPVSKSRLFVTLENALRFSRLARTTSALEAEAEHRRDLVGTSASMQRLRSQIDRIGPTEGRVLIYGENGTGKELVASAIHMSSTRRHEPLVRLNCGAIPAELIESELFGHEKGAFTGAVASRKGRFELADRGTLFLDEIGDMPAQMQVKLLRVLQEGTFERVGGSRTLRVDVRVIAATNKHLGDLVRSGAFREDLYYRLKVVALQVPPLRERTEDIPELVAHFAAAAARRSGRPPIELARAAMQRLQGHPFPGNVRELQNVVEGLVILGDGPVVDVSELEPLLSDPGARRERSLFRPGLPYRDLLEGAERAILRAAIAANGNSKSAAAKAVGLDRSHFYRKCRQLGVDGTEDE